MDQEVMRRLVDSRMQLLQQYLLVDARGSGADFSRYNRWLRVVANAMADRETAPAPDDGLILEAAVELAPFRRPNPQTKDLELLAAIGEQTDLGKLGPFVVRLFRDETEVTRASARDYLLATYALP